MSQTFQDEFSDEEESSPLDLKVLLLYGVARSRRLVLGLALVGLLIGLFQALSRPNTYVSEAGLAYRPGLLEGFNAEGAAGLGDDGGKPMWPGMADEIMLLDDPRVFERVAREVGPARILAVPDPGQYDNQHTSFSTRILHQLQRVLMLYTSTDPGHINDDSPLAIRKAAEVLQRRTSLQAGRSSQVISVTHQAYSKADSQLINRALLRAFIERHLEHYDVARAYARNADKVQELFEEYKLKEDEYREHIDLCGFLDIDAQKAGTIMLVDQFKQDLSRSRSERVGVLAKLAKSRKQLELLDESLEMITPPVMTVNPRWQTLYDNLVDFENQLLLLESQNLPRERLASERDKLNTQIEAVKRRMDSVAERVETVPETRKLVPNTLYFEVAATIAELEGEDERLNAAIASLEQEIKVSQDKLDRIAVCSAVHKYHQNRITTDHEAWMAVNQKLKLQENLKALGEEGEANLSVWSDATLPLFKFGPSRIKPVFGGLLLGALLGVLLAALRQFFDKRVRYPEVAESALGLKVLGVVPEVRTLRRVPGSKHSHAA